MINDKFAVLLVDDSVDDRLFIRNAVERSSKLEVVGEMADGQSALDYLSGEGVFQDRVHYPWPDLVLLDLKMPGKDGFDVLTWVKTGPLKHLTTVILSGSWLAEDMAKSAALGADGYFKKTCVREEEDEMIQCLENLLSQSPKPSS